MNIETNDEIIEKIDEMKIDKSIVNPFTSPNTSTNNHSNPDGNNKIEKVKRNLVVEEEIIPTPFNNNLYWPESKEIRTKRIKNSVCSNFETVENIL